MIIAPATIGERCHRECGPHRASYTEVVAVVVVAVEVAVSCSVEALVVWPSRWEVSRRGLSGHRGMGR